MRISELAKESRTPVATIKYYIREGLLPAGTPVNARQSDYGTQHLERLRLIRGLMHVLGASIEQVRDVIDVIHQPDQEPWEAMKFATEAIPAPHQHEESRAGKARVVLEQFGLPCSPEHPAVRHLDVALAFAEEIGMAMSSEQLAVYVEAARRTARADIERVPELTILSEGDAGPYIIANLKRRQFFITGHAEYDPLTLKAEYDRDLAAGMHPDIPLNYYPKDDPSRPPIVRWRSVAHLLFANWLNYYVYQGTPYELDSLDNTED